MEEILNAYVSFPFDREKDKDLFKWYSELFLLLSQVEESLKEPLNTKDIYHIVITRTRQERSEDV